MKALEGLLRSRLLAYACLLGVVVLQLLLWDDGKVGGLESLSIIAVGIAAVFLLFEIANMEKSNHHLNSVNIELNEVNRKYREDIKSLQIVTDNAYHERNRLVALLARMFPSGVSKTEIEGWDPAWHNCVYIDLPTGQVSYHFHDREAPLFEGLPPYQGKWDGHTKDIVHERWADPSTRSWLIPVDYIRRWAYERRNLAYNCIELRADEVANMLFHTEEIDKMLAEFVTKRSVDDGQLMLDLRELSRVIRGQRRNFEDSKVAWAAAGA